MPDLQANLGLAILIHSTNNNEETGYIHSETTVKEIAAYEKNNIALKQEFHQTVEVAFC